MVDRFVNSYPIERIWGDLSHPDGGSLHLQPGEEVELDLPADFEDPYLTRVPKAKVKHSPISTGESESAPTPEQETGGFNA